MESVLVKTKQLNKYLFPKNQYFPFYNHYKRNNPAMSVQTLIFSTPSRQRTQRISADSATSAMEKNTGKRGLLYRAPVFDCASWHKNLAKINNMPLIDAKRSESNTDKKEENHPCLSVAKI